MYKICALLTLGLVAVSGLAHAQEDAMGFAKKVQAFYEKSQDASMDFSQDTYVELLEKEVRKKGVAKFKKPGKFLIRYEGKNGRNYVCDGRKIWYFESGDNQVQTYDLNDDSIPAEALSFLVGLGNLTKDFAVEEVDPKKWEQLKVKKREDWRWLELTPLEKRSTLQWLVMGFDKASGVAQEVYLYTDSGNLSHYLFEHIELNKGVADSEFELKKGKGKDKASPKVEAL